MRRRGAVVAVIALAVASECVAVAAQTNEKGPTVERIDVSGGRPILDALGTLQNRYELAITYEEPRYVSPQDIRDITYIRTRPGPRILTLRPRTVHFQYAAVNGNPQEDITTLIGRLLSEYANQGGPVFGVRERTTPNGPEWNVTPRKARDGFGSLVDQADVLGTVIYIPEERRSVAEMLAEICRQLAPAGYRVELGTYPIKQFNRYSDDFGVDNQAAREALVNVLGRFPFPLVWQLNYDPSSGAYWLNVTYAPYHPERKAAPAVRPAAPSGTQPLPPGHIPLGAVYHKATTRRGISRIQSALAGAGFYSGEPSGEWDAKTADALKRFQAANEIAPTGSLDPVTIRKLGLDVSTPRQQ